MPSYRIISSDSHVIEPPGLWIDRADPTYRDRVPRILREADGGDVWHCDGQSIMSVRVGTRAGVKFQGQETRIESDVFEHTRPGGYIPQEHVNDMDVDGVEAGVLYPSVGLMLFIVQDTALLNVIFRTYNDWVAQFCKAYPKRLKGIAMINVDDVGLAVQELERATKIGLSGAMIPSYLPWGESYALPKYEPLWAAAQDLQLPLSLHAASNRVGQRQPLEFGDPRDPRPAHQVNRDHWVRESLCDIIFIGIFERYPMLRVGAVEFELSWVAHFMDRMDYAYTQRSLKPEWHRYKEDMLPSDYVHRNVFLSFQEDGLGIRLRDVIGVDNLMWGSDYPHADSTFPRSREVLEEILVGCTEEEKAKIAGGNAARLYRLD